MLISSMIFLCEGQIKIKKRHKMLNLMPLNCLLLFSIHLKLELLPQFPASNDKKYFIFMKNSHIPNLIICLTEHISQTI